MRVGSDQPNASQETTDVDTTVTKSNSVADVAVIIPHYDDAVRLERCLTALMLNNLDKVEVLVIDNDSPNPPGETLSPHFPLVRFLTEPEKLFQK